MDFKKPGGTERGAARVRDHRHQSQVRVGRRGNTVVVWSESAPRPVAVCYAWSKNPKATLFNRAGLPACGFRTDKWPGITERSGAMGGVDNV
jgi:hypothetical protein